MTDLPTGTVTFLFTPRRLRDGSRRDPSRGRRPAGAPRRGVGAPRAAHAHGASLSYDEAVAFTADALAGLQAEIAASA